MTTVKLKYIKRYIDRHGHERCYFRRVGHPVEAIDGVLGSSEFMEHYNRLLAESESKEPKARRSPVKAGTFDALAGRYFASPNFLRLTPVAQKNYRSVLGRFLEEHGHRLAGQMTREHVDSIIGKMKDKPGAAVTRLKRLRTLVRYGMEIGWLGRDPTAGATAFKLGEHHTWTDDEIAAFEARWPIGTKQRLAFAAHLYTGQRTSDVVDMARPKSPMDIIRVKQSKTGEDLDLAIHPEFWAIMEATPRHHAVLLATEQGKSYTVPGLGNYMAEAIGKAGLPDRCVTHGLRKAAARKLAEAGCTAHQIKSVTGHRTLAEVERYTRAADQKRLNREALAKQLENAKVSTLYSASVYPVENTGKK